MDNFDKFYNKALRFLSFRPRSEKEIQDYLTKKKLDGLTMGRIIKSLKNSNFLNDEEFAKWWIEQRTIMRPKSTRVIKMELVQKGISKELIENSFEANVVSDFENAKKIAQKKMAQFSKLEDKKKIYEKMARFLSSKGFDWDTIKEVIDPIFSKEYNN